MPWREARLRTAIIRSTVLAAGQKGIEVHGPFSEIEDELIAPHRGFRQR